MGLADVKKRLVSLFHKKEKEVVIPKEWLNGAVEKDEVKPEVETKVKRARLGFFTNRLPRLRLPKVEPIHVPISLKLRRIIAFLLMISFFLSGISSVETIFKLKTTDTIIYMLSSSLIEFTTAIILLDYLFKTRVEMRSKEWYKRVDEVEEGDRVE